MFGAKNRPKNIACCPWKVSSNGPKTSKNFRKFQNVISGRNINLNGPKIDAFDREKSGEFLPSNRFSNGSNLKNDPILTTFWISELNPTQTTFEIFDFQNFDFSIFEKKWVPKKIFEIGFLHRLFRYFLRLLSKKFSLFRATFFFEKSAILDFFFRHFLGSTGPNSNAFEL